LANNTIDDDVIDWQINLLLHIHRATHPEKNNVPIIQLLM